MIGNRKPVFCIIQQILWHYLSASVPQNLLRLSNRHECKRACHVTQLGLPIFAYIDRLNNSTNILVCTWVRSRAVAGFISLWKIILWKMVMYIRCFWYKNDNELRNFFIFWQLGKYFRANIGLRASSNFREGTEIFCPNFVSYLLACLLSTGSATVSWRVTFKQKFRFCKLSRSRETAFPECSRLHKHSLKIGISCRQFEKKIFEEWLYIKGTF